MFQEFKAFLKTSNALALAVAVIIGAAVARWSPASWTIS